MYVCLWSVDSSHLSTNKERERVPFLVFCKICFIKDFPELKPVRVKTKTVWKHYFCFQFDFQRSFLEIPPCPLLLEVLRSLFQFSFTEYCLAHKTPITENNTFTAESVFLLITRVSYLTRKMDCLCFNKILRFSVSSELTRER